MIERRNIMMGFGGLLPVVVVLFGLTPRASAAMEQQDAGDVARVMAGKHDLSGKWILNEKESDNVREALGRQRGGGGSGGRAGAGGRSGGEGGSGQGGFRGRSGGGPGRGGARGFFLAAQTLVITQTDSTVSISQGEGRSTVYFTDGRSEKSNEGQRGTELQTSWKKDELVVERKGERGRFRQTYALSKDGETLYVTVNVEGGPRGSLELKRVYDAADKGS